NEQKQPVAVVPPPQPQPTPVPVSPAPKTQPATTIASTPRTIERVTVERVVSNGGISEALLNSRLTQLQKTLEDEIHANSVAYSTDTSKIYQALSLSGGGGGGGTTNVTNVTNVNGVTTFVALTDVPNALVAGDILYSDSADHLAALPVGADGMVLKLSGGFPTWAPDLT